MGRTKPGISNEYVVGLTDREGCFYVHIRTSSAYRARAAVQMHFHLKLQERDRQLLEMVRDRIGCGAVYSQKEQRANHCQCYRYTVSAMRDIENMVIPFFTKYPLQSASKKANFDLFCQIAQLVKAQKHLTSEGLDEIRALKRCMNVKTPGLA